MVCKVQYIVFCVFSIFLTRPHLLNEAKFFFWCPTCNILGDDCSSPFHADAFPAFESALRRRRGFCDACCGVFLESVCLCNAEEFKGDGEGVPSDCLEDHLNYMDTS